MVREVLRERQEDILCICTTTPEPNFKGEKYLIDETQMKLITGLSTPSSHLAVVRMPKFTKKEDQFVLVVDGVQDPGNMGTLIRTADWFGVHRIVCSIETVDLYNPKVVQSTMGSIFRVPVVYTDLGEYLSQSKLPKYGALMEGKSLQEYRFEGTGILVVGNEGNGVSAEIVDKIDHPVHIPGKGGAESLNVAVAAGILMAAIST